MRFRICYLSSSIGNCWMNNLRLGETLRWKMEDRRLGRSGSVMWQASISKVVSPAYVG
jgi:hypothetical protein